MWVQTFCIECGRFDQVKVEPGSGVTVAPCEVCRHAAFLLWSRALREGGEPENLTGKGEASRPDVPDMAGPKG